MIRGSCLCGAIRIEINGRLSPIGKCHCSLCRKTSGVASNAVLLTAVKSLRWVSGEDHVQTWSRPSGWTAAWCRTCGCPAPLAHPSGKLCWVPAGMLDDDPVVGVAQHIFVGSKAPWDRITDGAPQYEEAMPPRHELEDSAP